MGSRGLASLIGAVAVAVAQDTTCAGSLAAPVYPQAAREERHTGQVQLSFAVSVERKLQNIECAGVDTLCMAAVASVRKTEFPAACANSRVEVVFEFMLEGEPSADAVTTVTFRTPNRYLITSNPAPPRPVKRNPRSSVQRPCATCSRSQSV